MKTTVVHCKKSSYDVYIGRGSPWGNPFIIGVNGDRENVIMLYEEWLLKQPHLLEKLHELKGKRLACWCSPQRCHGDILIKYIEKQNND